MTEESSDDEELPARTLEETLARLERGAADRRDEAIEFSFRHIGDAGAALFADALRASATVASLSLQGNSIGPKGAGVLADALRGNTCLLRLDLYGNYVGNEGAAALGAALGGTGNNSTLRSLSLQCCSIGAAGAAPLAAMLRENVNLQSLKLGDNQVGAAGAAALALALRCNRTLQALNLNNNKIGDEGLGHVAEALSRADGGGGGGAAGTAGALRCLWLYDTGATSGGVARLASALRTNRSLQWLFICEDGVEEALLADIAEALERNKAEGRARAARAHMSALRIHRFWRDVCFDPSYVHARQRILRCCALD